MTTKTRRLQIAGPRELQNMAESRLRGAPKGARKAENPQAVAGRGSILLDDELNRVQIMLEQIAGLAEAMESHLRERYERFEADSGALTLIEVVKERSEQASLIVGRSYGVFPPAVVEQREKNIRTREQGELDIAKRDAKLAKRAEKIKAALDSIS